jgi:hypothetical protein
MDNIVDLTEDPVFRKEDWMGKLYPTSDVPQELRMFCDAALEIPAALQEALLPDSNLSVNAFVELHLPTTQATLISFGAKSCFSKMKPTKNISCLKTRKLPSLEFVEDAEVSIGQALLDGAQSINDPAYKGEGLPIWTIRYWRMMHAVAKGQAGWKDSIRWLDTYGTKMESLPELDQARKSLSSLGWRADILAPGATTKATTVAFSRLLSDKMLTTTLVDMMVEHIAAWVKADKSRADKFEVVSLIFINDIEKAKSADDYKKKSPGYLHKVEERLKGSSKVLLFPVHLPHRTHFDAFEIDYKKCTISYGELVNTIHVHGTDFDL